MIWWHTVLYVISGIAVLAALVILIGWYLGFLPNNDEFWDGIIG